MFSHINNVLARVATDLARPGLAQQGYQEILWTVVRLAHVARRQALPEACVGIVAKIHTVSAASPTDMSDSFAKLREQVRSCLQMPTHLEQGLRALEAVDAELLPQASRAQLFQLKGELLTTMLETPPLNPPLSAARCASGAAAAFATAIALHPEVPKAWRLWAGLCERELASARETSDTAAATKAATHALSCHLLAIQLGGDKALQLIPGALALLGQATSDEEAQALAEVFGGLCAGVPLWQWIPWLPQLFEALEGVDGEQHAPHVSMVQHLLVLMTKAYPQALYYPLRRFLKDTNMDAAPPKVWQPPEVQAAPAAAPAAMAAVAAAPAVAVAPAVATAPVVAAAPAETAAPTVTAQAPTAGAPAGDASMDDAPMDDAPMDDAPALAAGAHGGAAAHIFAALSRHQPELLAQLEAVADSLEASLAPTSVEHLLACLSALSQLCLSASPSPSADRIPPSVHTAIAAISVEFGFGHAETAAGKKTIAEPCLDTSAPNMASLTDLADFRRMHGGRFVKDFVSERPSTLSELLTRLERWRVFLEASLSRRSMSCQRALPSSADWKFLAAQPPMVEVPGQYALTADSSAEPLVDTHALIERLSASVSVRRNPATGVTSRTVSIRADDGKVHQFIMRRDAPAASLRGAVGAHSRERVAQLAALLNRRLLKARESRRRALQIHTPAPVRLGGGNLLELHEPSTISLLGALLASRAEAAVPNAPALTFQRTLATGASAGDDADVVKERHRHAYKRACKSVSDTVFAEAMQEHLTMASQRWDLRRMFTSQFGLLALLSHAIGLRVQQPHSLIVLRSSGVISLREFDAIVPEDEDARRAAAAAEPSSAMVDLSSQGKAAGVPFRLTRNLLRFVTPIGVDGSFAAAFGAAAEAFAEPRKCALAVWLDFLATPPLGPANAYADANAVAPWARKGAEAAQSVRDVAPALLVKDKGPATDVHAQLRALIYEATDDQTLEGMPPAWQAWL